MTGAGPSDLALLPPGVHAMQPDRRHTMCGFDLIPEGLPFGEFLIRDVDCPACLDAIGAVA